MKEQSMTYSPRTSEDSHAATSSQASAGGTTPCSSQAGQQTDLFGQEVAPASRSVSPVGAKESTTSGTSGQSSTGSSRSAGLQRSLANRLRARLGVNGSLEYRMTWKEWDMPSQVPICALRASARHTLGSGCIGWPTLIKRDGFTLLRARRAPNATGSEPMAWMGGVVTGLVKENRAGLKMDRIVGLNPAWTSWLMGFPDEWSLLEAMATPSSHKSRRSS